MFSKLFVVALAVMGVLANDQNCSSGPVQCCNSVQSASPTTLASISGLLGGLVVPLSTNIGFDCSPITVIGLGTGSTCQAQTVCCENNNFNGVIALGCNPINLIL